MTGSFARNALATFLAGIVLLAGCGDQQPDAYGNFEARDVVVSAELAGRLTRFDAREGDRLVAGAVVARVDTAGLALQRAELLTQQRASRTRAVEAAAQVDALVARLATARDEYERTLRLYESEAATAQRLNQTGGEVRVIEENIEAARARAAAVRDEVGGTDARLEQIDERIGRSRVTNPVTGTVLATYAEAGEYTQPGAPLYRIASLDTLTLRAYVGGDQLAALRLGAQVRVQVDAADDELMALPGRLTWVASEAEFTPTPIQTRDERADQVYAIEVRVPNPDGVIKVGMPGEVVFTEGVTPEPDA